MGRGWISGGGGFGGEYKRGGWADRRLRVQVEGGWKEDKQVGTGAKERVEGGVRDTKERASRGLDTATEGAGAAAPGQVLCDVRALHVIPFGL